MFGLLRNFYYSLVGRLFLVFVLPTCIVMAVVISLAARSGFQNLRASSEDSLSATAALVALRIEKENSEASKTAQRMAEAQASGMFGERATSVQFAKTVLESFPEVTAAYFGYEPNADNADADSLLTELPSEAMDPNGRFIPYWFVEPGDVRRIELEPLVNMETSDYYTGCKAAFEKAGKPVPVFTEPYVYQGKMIVEHTYPIVIEGRFAGVAGIDRALVDLENKLRQMAKDEDVDLYLISANGRFIAATVDPLENDTEEVLKTQEVAATDYADLFGTIFRSNHELTLRDAPDPLNQQVYYFVSAKIPTGNWTLILRKSEDSILAPIRSQLIQRVGIVVIALVGMVCLLGIVGVRLAGRIRRAASAAERIANGDLTQHIEAVSCQDETGTLLRSIGVMTDNLNTLVGNVKHASIQLNSTATELAATSREQQSTVSSFGASSTQIAAAVKQISATTTELVGTMAEVSLAASDATKLATAGQEGLTEMDSNMRGLDDATASFGDKLSVINEKAANITGIVTTITKVADQTNLLSVNAAIEAEKAGEYGVGFLVVAREIRRLADQTASATLDIEQMVQQMQSAVSAGVMEMDRFTDQVRHSVKDVELISNQLSEVIARVQANTVRFERVNESMKSQAQGADQINSAMSQLATHASGSADAADEYARAASELQDAIDSLKSSISSFQLRAE